MRPAISRSPKTENITAGSVGATAAPSRPEVSQPSPSAQWANAATSPAVANVPRTPSETIGTAATRKRRQPIDEPPSKRITISATVATRSTVATGTWSDENTSEATAAATRKNAAEGTEVRGAELRSEQRCGERAGHQQDVEPEMCDVVHPVQDKKVLTFRSLEA